MAAQAFFRHALRLPPAQTLGGPEFVPRHAVLGGAEKFHLHLFELAGAENEIARRHLVTECFADLRDAERQPHARGVQHVFVFQKNALRRFGTQINFGVLVLKHADIGVEHQIKRARLGQSTGIFRIGTDDEHALFGVQRVERHSLR